MKLRYSVNSQQLEDRARWLPFFLTLTGLDRYSVLVSWMPSP